MSQVTLTTVTNNALILLGSTTRLTDIDGPGSLAAQARDLYPLLIPQVLAKHPWNFALERTEVPRENVDPLTGEWAYRFQLPAGYLRWLPWDEEDDDFFDGVEESGYILSNCEGPIVVRCIMPRWDLTTWSALALSALAALAATYLGETIAAKATVINRVSVMYDDLIGDAKRADGLASNKRRRPSPARLSNAVGAMQRGRGGDPARWHR